MSTQAEELLDSFIQTPGVPPGAPKQAIKKINYSHAAMIDLILARPGISQNEIAAHFGFTASWISMVMSSDAFETALAARRAEMVDPVLALTIEERFKGMVARSQEILMEKLAMPSHQVSDQLAVRAFELSTRALGYGAKTEPPPPAVNVNLHLDHLGDRLVGLLHKKRAELPPIDAEIEES